MHQTVLRSLDFDHNEEFLKLISFLEKPGAPIFNSGMKLHFSIAKEKPLSFLNHPPVLAVSLGGTNLKLMIASMENGQIKVKHVYSRQNPENHIDFYDYFDELLAEDEHIRNYLFNSETSYLGFSFPMPVINGVPYHPTKVPTLDGVILRDKTKIGSTWNFENNFQNYLRSRSIPPAKMFYQADGIIAHHGAVGICDVDYNCSTTLVICGTGLATGDEENYIQMGIIPMLDIDEKIFPRQETEYYQYHYAAAGRFFGLMDRCIKLKAKEDGSYLKGVDLHNYFSTTDGAKTTIQIWQSALGSGLLEEKARTIYEQVGETAFMELQQIAVKLVNYLIESVANCVVATIAKMGIAPNGKGHNVFFEGSIANNPYVFPRLKQAILSRISESMLFKKIGVTQPIAPDMEKALRPLIHEQSVKNHEINQVDLSLIGSVTSVIAEMCLRERNSY